MQIGEVARRVGMATSAIRFYEDAGLLSEPERTAAGNRKYDQSVKVGLLNELREVLIFGDRGEAPCRHVRFAA